MVLASNQSSFKNSVNPLRWHTEEHLLHTSMRAMDVWKGLFKLSSNYFGNVGLKQKSQMHSLHIMTHLYHKSCHSLLNCFFNRRINSHLGITYQPTTLTDTEKDRLFEKRSGHLSSQESQNEYFPHQLVWFTEDGSSDWKPGFVESKAPYPDSYWIITANNERRLRRNSHDLKPRTAIQLQVATRHTST